jgi:hypothetical protein
MAGSSSRSPETDTSRSRRGSHAGRPRLLLGLSFALLGWVASGCEEAGSNPADGIIEAWRKAGLMPAVFTKLEDESLRPGKCQQGKVDGVSVVLCEYADAAAARAAHNTGLAHVGETTGLALPAGKMLLVVSDPDKADPSGRKIDTISATFRDTLVPKKPAAEQPEAKADGKPGDKADGKDGDKPEAKADDKAAAPADKKK